jgi:hypothetical protein
MLICCSRLRSDSFASGFAREKWNFAESKSPDVHQRSQRTVHAQLEAWCSCGCSGIIQHRRMLHNATAPAAKTARTCHWCWNCWTASGGSTCEGGAQGGVSLLAFQSNPPPARLLELNTPGEGSSSCDGSSCMCQLCQSLLAFPLQITVSRHATERWVSRMRSRAAVA